MGISDGEDIALRESLGDVVLGDFNLDPNIPEAAIASLSREAAPGSGPVADPLGVSLTETLDDLHADTRDPQAPPEIPSELARSRLAPSMGSMCDICCACCRRGGVVTDLFLKLFCMECYEQERHTSMGRGFVECWDLHEDPGHACIPWLGPGATSWLNFLQPRFVLPSWAEEMDFRQAGTCSQPSSSAWSAFLGGRVSPRLLSSHPDTLEPQCLEHCGIQGATVTMSRSQPAKVLWLLNAASGGLLVGGGTSDHAGTDVFRWIPQLVDMLMLEPDQIRHLLATHPEALVFRVLALIGTERYTSVRDLLGGPAARFSMCGLCGWIGRPEE